MLLKTRIVAGASVAMVVLSAGFMLTHQVERERLYQHFSAEKTAIKGSLLEQIVDEHRQKLTVEMKGLSRNSEALASIAAGESDAGEQVLMGGAATRNPLRTTFIRLHAGKIIDGLVVTDLSGRELFREPKTADATRLQALSARAQKDGKAAFSVVQGAPGSLFYAAAFPLFMAGKPVGNAVYLRDFKNVLDQLKANDHSEVMAVSQDGQILYVTDTNFFQNISLEQLRDAAKSGSSLQRGDELADVTMMPVHDVNGLVVANVFTVKDNTAIYAAQRQAMLLIVFGFAAFLIVFLAGMAVWLRRQFWPLTEAVNVIGALSQGYYNVKYQSANRKDEIGALASAIDVFRERLVLMDNMHSQQVEAEHRAEEQRRTAMLKLALRLENAVGTIVATVASASTQLHTAAEALHTTAQLTSEQSAAVVTASGVASDNVRTVASAAEEMTCSIREIAQQMERSNTMTSNASDAARRAADQVRTLESGAKHIGGIIDLINDIAAQTNLLALNATVEAARAGEAGKGFAVVAQEVKTLSLQTAKATADIRKQVEAIQNSTRDSVLSIGAIASTISEVDAIAGTISGAVEEQQAAIQEIACSISGASQRSEEVTTSIGDVRDAAVTSSSSAAQVLSAAEVLARQSEALQLEMMNFLRDVRAA